MRKSLRCAQVTRSWCISLMSKSMVTYGSRLWLTSETRKTQITYWLGHWTRSARKISYHPFSSSRFWRKIPNSNLASSGSSCSRTWRISKTLSREPTKSSTKTWTTLTTSRQRLTKWSVQPGTLIRKHVPPVARSSSYPPSISCARIRTMSSVWRLKASVDARFASKVSA